MTVERAKAILKDAIGLFTTEANKTALAAAVAECNALPEQERQMAKMTKLIPLVTGMVGPKLLEHGLPNARSPASAFYAAPSSSSRDPAREPLARRGRRGAPVCPRRWVTWDIRSWWASCRSRASQRRTRPSARPSEF